MAPPRFFAPALDPGAGVVTLPPEEAHHLQHVLRLGAGAPVRVFTGMGREWSGRVAAVSPGVTVALVAELDPVGEPPVRVTVGLGVLKGDHMTGAISDAAMLGAFAVAPVAADHVAAPPSAWRGATAVARWQRAAIAGAKQSGRAVVPVVSPASDLDGVLAGPRDTSVLMCVEPSRAGSRSMAIGDTARPAAALVLIGPEGGWSPAEVDLAVSRGARLVHLGPRTIRAERAPAIVLAALWTIWGWS